MSGDRPSLTRPLGEVTPVEDVDGIWVKRDDALSWTSGINGKIRTTLYLGILALHAGATAVVYAGSVRAPAIARAATAAAYLGLDATIVLGGTRYETAVRHPYVRAAVEAGARLWINPVGYNPAIQRAATELAASRTADGEHTAQIHYGITTAPGASPDEVRRFLEVDARQVTNVPDGVRTLVIPFGSGNVATAVLYALATRYPHPTLREVVLMGVGPDRVPWLRYRLAAVGLSLDGLPVTIRTIPLYPEFARYEDAMPHALGPIALHPTYEGKVVRWLDLNRPDFWTRRDGSTALWIVGGPYTPGGAR